METNRMLKSTKAALQNKYVLTSVVFVLLIAGILGLRFVLAQSSADNVIIKGDLPDDSTSYVIRAYDGYTSDPCPGATGTLLDTITASAAAGDPPNDNDDYSLDGADDNGLDGVSNLWIYFCQGQTSGDLRLAYNYGVVSSDTTYYLDLGKVVATSVHSDLYGDRVIVCDAFNGNELSSEKYDWNTISGGSYTQFYAIDQGESGSPVNDYVYVLMDTDANSATCDFDATISAGRKIRLNSADEKYGVYVTFAPDTKATGDAHSDFDGERSEIYGNGINLGLNYIPQGNCDASSHDDFSLYYDVPSSGSLRLNFYDGISSDSIEDLSSLGLSFGTQDVVFKISGTVPDDIDEVKATDSNGVTYSTVPGANGAYELYIADTETITTSVAVNFYKGGNIVFSKSVTVPTQDGSCGNDVTLNLAKYYGDTHSELWDDYEISVYSDSSFSTELSDASYRGDPTEADDPDYEVYFDATDSPQTYVLIDGSTYDTEVYGDSATPGEKIEFNPDDQLKGTVHSDINKVQIDDWNSFKEARTTTFDSSYKYELYTEQTGSVNVNFYTPADGLVLTRTKSFSDVQLDVAKIAGNIDSGFNTGGTSPVWVYDSHPGSPLNSKYFVSSGSPDSYYAYFEATSSEQNGNVDVKFKDDSGANEYTLRLDVDQIPGDGDKTNDAIVGGNLITLDMTNTLTGTLPASINYLLLESNGEDYVKLGITGTWPHSYTMYYDTITTSEDWYIKAYDQVYDSDSDLYNVLRRNKGSSLPASFDVAKVVGEAHSNLESGDDLMHIYTSSDCSSGKVSTEDFHPEDNGYLGGANDYAQYFEDTGNGPYYVQSTMNDNSDSYVTCGNDFSITSGAGTTVAAHDIVVDKTGDVTSDIAKVGVDWDGTVPDDNDAETSVVSDQYHLFTMTDGDVDVNYYDSTPSLLLKIDESFPNEDTYTNDISKVTGSIPTDITSVELEYDTGTYADDACGGAYYTQVTPSSGSYTLYFQDTGSRTYNMIFCKSGNKVLEWSFDDPSGGQTFTIDAAKISGQVEDSFDNAGFGVYDDRSAATPMLLSSTSFYTDSGDADPDNYEVYFVESDDSTGMSLEVDNVDLKMTDIGGYVSWRMGVDAVPSNYPADDAIKGGDMITLDLDNKLIGDVHSDIDEIYLSDKTDAYVSPTAVLAIGETVANGCNKYAMYFDTLSLDSGHKWYLEGRNAAGDLLISRNKGTDSSALGSTFNIAKLSGTVDPSFVSADALGQQVGDSPSVDVYGKWNDSSPGTPYNSHSFLVEGDDDYYTTYVESTTAIEDPDIRFIDENGYVSWNIDFAADGGSISGCDNESFNADVLVTGDVPEEADSRVTVKDDSTLFAAAIPKEDGTYNMYADAYEAGSGTLQYRVYRNAYAGQEVLRRDTESDPLADDVFDVAKISGDLEDGFRDSGEGIESVDVLDDYSSATPTNYGDNEDDSDFITNADSYEEWFEVDDASRGLDYVDVKFTDEDGYVSWINDFTDSSSMGVSGGDNNDTIDHGESLNLDLSYMVHGSIPSDIDYMYLYDEATLLAIGEDNSGKYRTYVSPDWSASPSTFDYAVDNDGAHNGLYQDGIELLRDSGISGYSANDQWDVSKISGGLDADFDTTGPDESFHVVDDWTLFEGATEAHYNRDGTGVDYWFINNVASDEASVEKYEVYFEHQSGTTLYDMAITEDDGTTSHTYYMDDVDDSNWGLIGDGISAGESQDWDLIAEKSGIITEEALNLPLKFAEVTFYDNDGSASTPISGTDLQLYTETISDGSYVVYTIPKKYDVTFRKPGFVSQYDDELDLSSSDVLNNDKTLLYTVKVRLNDHSGQPLGEAFVEIFNCTNETALVNYEGVPEFVDNPLDDKVMPMEYYYFPVITLEEDLFVGVQVNKTGWLSIRDPDPSNPNAEKFLVSEYEQQILGSPYEMIDSAPVCDMDLNITEGKDGDDVLVKIDCNGESGLDVTLDASTVDNVASYPVVMTDIGNGVYELSFTVGNSITDGTYEIWAYANDGVSTSQVVEDFTVDNTAPEIESISSDDADDSVIAGTTLTITVTEKNSEAGLTGAVTITGADSTVVVSSGGLVDNQDGTYYYEYPIPEGETAQDYTVKATLTDSVGLSDDDGSPTYTYTVVPTAGPIIENLEADPEETKDSDVVITANASNTESKITDAEYFIGSVGSADTGTSMNPSDGTFDSVSEGLTATIPVGDLSEGKNRIYVHAKDEAGNWGSFEYIDVMKDTAEPVVTITNPTAGTSTEASFELNVETDETATCEYNIDTSGSYTIMTNTNSITHSTDIESLTDGQHTIDVRCTDSLGDAGTDSVTWTVVSTSGPTSTITDLLPDPAIETDVNVTMTGGFASSEKTIAAAEYKVGMSGTLVVIAASDLGDGSYDNTQEDFTTTIPASSFVDGVNTIYLRAQDSEGNWGIWTEEEVVYDAAAPSISFDEIPEEVAGTLTLSISTSDNDIEDVVFEYATNNDGTGVWTTIGTDDTVSFNIDWDTTEVPDGEYCVKATATDDVGRTGETSELCFEVDNGVSGVPTLIHPADSSYVSSSPELQWNAVDGAEDYRVIVSDATDYNNKVIDQIVSGTSYDTLSDSLSVETEYYWHVVARDSDGDEGQYSSTWWFIIDSTPPQVSLTSIDGPVSGTIPIEATSTSTDVENVEFRYKETEAGSWTVIGVAENSPYVLDWDTTEVNDGSYDVKAVATDRAGNQASDTMETSFMIDNTAPTATINTAVYGPYNSDPGAVVDVDFADAGAGSDSITAEYKIGSGGSWQTITSCNGVASPCEDDWSVDWADLAEGENTIYMRTTDSLGNSEELVQTLTFVKDTTAPEILFVNPSKGMVTADDFSLLVHTNEDASCEYNLDGETSGDMDTTGSTMHEKSMSGLSDGEHAIAVTCEDLAGNSDTTEALTWIVTNEDAYIASVALDPYYTSEAPDVTARAIHPDNALIEQVEYFIRSIGSNMPSEEEYDSGTDLPAKDGEFNETEEQVEGTLEIEELQDGEYVMYIHAKAGGEWGPFDGELFTLDTTSPEIFDIMPDEDIPGSGEVTAVTVSAKTSEKADCRIIVSEVNYYDMTGDGSVYHKGTIPLLTDGEYSYTIECTDRVGLSNTALVSFEIDSEGPTVTMDDLPEYSLTSFMVSWSGSDSGVGIEGYSVQYKKGGEETWTDWIVDENVVEESYTGDEGETVYFRAKATDRVGNEGAYSSTVSTVIDGAPPTIINSGPSETLDTSDITLFVETNEEASCRYARSPMEYSAMENSLATEDDLYHSVDITGLEEGHHGFYIRCVDVAGNEMAVSEKIEFTVDTSSNYGYVAELTPVWDSFFLSKLILDDLFGPVTHSTEFVLDSLEDEEGDPTYNIVWYFDGTYWRFYNPENEMNTLEEFNDEVSNPYWIKMLQADRLELAEGAST